MSFVTTLELNGLADAEGRITTIGHVFRQGDIAEGMSLNARLGGTSVPLQMDVKASWPDGSVKHAVLSFENPAGVDTGTLRIETIETAHDLPILSVADVATEQGYSFQVEIDGETLDVAALLTTGSDWLSGPLASELRVEKTLGDGLSVRVDVRATADGVIETSVIVGNDNVQTTGLAAKTYAVSITQNGDTVYQNDMLTQPHFTVWREKYSTAPTANTAHAVYDLDYLRQTALLPSVDDTIPLFDSNIYYDRLVDTDATFDPLELGGIDNVGGIDEDRGRTGVTPSYGLLTDDQHSYLLTQTAETREAMLELTDQYGAFSNYYRNPETGEAYFLEDTESNSFSTGVNKDLPGTGGVIDLRNDGLAQRNSVSHKPSEYYLSYLVTGDRYYADGLAHEAGSSLLLWANAVYLTEGGHVDFASQLREQAWVMRDLFYAASLAPDGSHAATVLNARLDAALQDYVDYYVNAEKNLPNEWGTTLTGEREGAWFIGGDLEGALQSYNGTAIDRPYWQDWFAMVIGQIALTGNENAIVLGQWMAGFGAERFLQDDFDPNHNLFSILDYPNSGGSRNLVNDATWERLNNAATSVGAVGQDVDSWDDQTFYAAAAWGGAASAFSGVRDARYAEALLWMTTRLTDDYIEAVFHNGGVPQFGVPVTFADYSIAGVQERTLGTGLAETIEDGDGNRIIHAGDGDDIIITGAGSHLVEGGEGADTITGGDGEDWFFGGSGADTLSGGAGINYLQGDRFDRDFGRSADEFVFTEILGTTTIGDFDAGQDRLVFNGLAGIDTASDVLAQFIDTEAGAVLIVDGLGTLTLRDRRVAELSENDILVTPAYDQILLGDEQNNVLVGNEGNDLLEGAGGNDWLAGAAGRDTKDGGAGSDWVQYRYSASGVTVDLTVQSNGWQSASGGDAEGDLIMNFENVYASDHDDVLTGDAARNYLIGRAGSDTISAGAGDDLVRGGSGADILAGGAGNDWVQYIGSFEGVIVDLNTDSVTGFQTASGGDAEGDQISGFERILGSDHGDTLTGDAEGNLLVGRAGDDTILAGAGNDRVRGDEGADILDGGTGIDWLVYTASGAGVSVDLNINIQTGLQSASGGRAEGDIVSGFERVIGSGHSDELVGNDEQNYLIGLNGDDTILGGGGNDIIRGGEGADFLDGGDGNDWLHYTASGEGVDIDLTVNAETGRQGAAGGIAQGDQIFNFEYVRGSEFDDVLTGNASNNAFVAGAGNDTVNGGAGNDNIRGGEGADVLNGGDGLDWLNYAASTSGVTVDLRVDGDTGLQAASGGYADGDTISGFERVTGSSHIDVLTGDAGRNHIFGGAGADTLTGGSGNDVLRGGTGADVFAFAGGDGHDTITDFERGTDKISIASVSFADLSITEKGAGLEIAYADGDTIYLAAIGSAPLTESDFLFG